MILLHIYVSSPSTCDVYTIYMFIVVGIIYAASILGAVIGYGGGSAMINVYIDVFTHNPKDYGLTSKDTLLVIYNSNSCMMHYHF